MAAAAETDERSLTEAGYSVEWRLLGDGFRTAIVSRGHERLRLDWVTDTSFRFFPAQKDEDFGYCLHWADLAVNKLLALVGRSEIRDYLDILELDRTKLSLGAMAWAACGKDQGYTPGLVLDQMNRHSSYQQSELNVQKLARPVELQVLKAQWITAPNVPRISLSDCQHRTSAASISAGMASR